MDLDSLKRKAHDLKAPEAADAEAGNVVTTEQGLVAALKAADARQLAFIRRAKTFFVIATAIFVLALIITILAPDANAPVWEERLLHQATLVCIYIIVTAVYGVTTKKLTRVDYAVPLNQFLNEAERRYRFMTSQDWLLALGGLLVVGVISTIGFVPYMSRVFGLSENPAPMYLIFPGFILTVAIMGFYFTWKNWKRDRFPLWSQIVQMQQELGYS